MESTEFTEKRTELEDKIRAFEEERNRLTAEVPVMKEKLATLRLEDKANTLENEVTALKSEVSLIEEEISRYSPEPSENTEQSSPEPEAKEESNEGDSGQTQEVVTQAPESTPQEQTW